MSWYRAHRAGILAVACLVSAAVTAVAVTVSRADEAKDPPAPLPRLVDLGAGKCVPCKKMAPILEELKKDYAGIVDVEFIDVWKNPDAGKPYRIRVIPTQVFYNREKKEVFRHEGFFSREEIERVFQEKLGVKPVKRGEGKDKGDGGGGEKEDDARTTGSLRLWNPGSDFDGEITSLVLGDPPDGPPLAIQVVYASIACACVMERCEREGRLIRELLAPFGEAVLQTWIDRVDQVARADSLRRVWGLEELPAVALVDHEGRIHYGDDEELDLQPLRAWLGSSL